MKQKKRKPVAKKSKKTKKTKTSTKKIRKTESKVPTGIKGLDKLIGGGFQQGSINSIGGSSGTGKTIFAMQFLMEGIGKGEAGLYITFEESKEEFYENMKKFGWDLGKLEKSGKFTFLEYSPEKIKILIDEGGGAIESEVIKHNVKRLVIDSISSFSLLFNDAQAKRQSIVSLLDIIRKWDCTTLMILQGGQLKGKRVVPSPIEYQADSLILLYFLKNKNKRERFLEVMKMRGTKHATETYHFSIDKGIKIGKKANFKL